MSKDMLLVIGGSKDGEFMALPEGMSGVSVMVPQSQDHEVYHLEVLAGETQRFRILKYEHLSGDHVMKKLIDGYKPTPS